MDYVLQSSSGDGNGFGALLFLIGLYLIPTIVALTRDHHNKGPIIVVNVFLGWTFIGWVVALAMAVGRVEKKASLAPTQLANDGWTIPRPAGDATADPPPAERLARRGRYRRRS